MFSSRRRTVPHRTASPRDSVHGSTRTVGTKRGDVYQHHFRCWFRSQCRGCHTDKEEAHFAECDRQALILDVQLEVVRAEQDTTTPHELTEDTFHDAPLIPPTRRKQRRLRKGQRARARRKDRAGLRLFRRAKRTECGHTRSVSMQTEQELRTGMTQTVQDSNTTSNTPSGIHHNSYRHTIDSSAREKEERMVADAMVHADTAKFAGYGITVRSCWQCNRNGRDRGDERAAHEA